MSVFCGFDKRFSLKVFFSFSLSSYLSSLGSGMEEAVSLSFCEFNQKAVKHLHKEINEDNPNICEPDHLLCATKMLLVGFPQNC